MNFRPFTLALAIAFSALILTGCEKPEEKEARYIRLGNVLFKQGEYEKARLEYKNAARIMPNDAEPRYLLGEVDEAQGDIRNAFGNFIAAEQQNSHYRPVLLKLAQYYMAAEEYDNAVKRLTIVLFDSPNDPEAHALHAALLLRQKNYVEAEKEARFALSKDSANINAIAVLTGVYSAQNDEAKAAATIEDGIAHTPDSLPLLLLKVALYEKSLNLNKITEAYQAIFKLAPAEIRYRVALSLTYMKAQMPDKAEQALRDGVAALPENWDMKKALVTFLSENRGLDAAEKEVRALMQANATHQELYFWLADLYIDYGATDRAVALLEQMVGKNEGDAMGLNARTSLAHIQFAKGNRALAEKLITAVLEKDPGNREALFIRAEIAFDEGHYQNAVSDLRTIIRDNPRATDAIGLFAEVLLLQGHLDLAIDTQNQLLEADPTNAAGRVRLAQMYVMNGNAGRAQELLALVTKTKPDYPVGWESTARVAINLKDWPAAETAIKKLGALKDQHLTALFLTGQEDAYRGRIDAAIPIYIEVINASPESPLAEHAFSALVEAYGSENRLQDAITAAGKLKEITPYMYSVMGDNLAKLGKNAEAATAYDKAIAGNPASPAPYIGRAKLDTSEHHEDHALAMLKKAQEVAPMDFRAPMMAAGIYASLGRPADAVSAYEHILADNPGMDAAANNLAQTIADYEYTDTTAMDKARQIAERFVGSPNPLFLDTLGWVYFRQGDIQQAQAVMERVIASSSTPLPPEVHYHYGALLVKIGKAPAAKSELTLAVAERADYPGLEDARKLLKNLN